MASNDGPKFHWEKLTPMPTKRVYSSPVECDGILYVVGGCDSVGAPVDTLESYDPKKNKWKRLANMPTCRAAPAVVATEGVIIAIGGVGNDQVPVNAVEKYDTKTKSWTPLKPLAEKVMGVSALLYGNKIIVIGGMKADTNPSEKVTVLDIKEDVWQELPSMPTPRYATAAYLKGKKIYVLGGRHGKKPTTAFEMLDLGAPVEERKWQKLAEIPRKRVFPCYAESETHFFSLGGLHENPQTRDPGDRFSDAMESYDIEKDKWTIHTPMICKRGDFSAAYLGGRVIAAVGMGNQGNALSQVESFDLETNTWEKLEPSPVPQCSCSSLVFQNRLYIIGGLSNKGPCNFVEALAMKK
ncbi:kelch domain-containing protein 8A-like [Ptychodera flava]|uniref:kelch domain-containing protein 8A-like n=1 Tax=Ptychodera flava TaxID=63121 RepID=UPI00396A1516